MGFDWLSIWFIKSGKMRVSHDFLFLAALGFYLGVCPFIISSSNYQPQVCAVGTAVAGGYSPEYAIEWVNVNVFTWCTGRRAVQRRVLWAQLSCLWADCERRSGSRQDRDTTINLGDRRCHPGRLKKGSKPPGVTKSW